MVNITFWGTTNMLNQNYSDESKQSNEYIKGVLVTWQTGGLLFPTLHARKQVPNSKH